MPSEFRASSLTVKRWQQITTPERYPHTLTSRETFEHARDNVPNTARNMDRRTLFADRETGRNHKGLQGASHQSLPSPPTQQGGRNAYQRYTLDEERPKSQEALHDESSNNALDLGDTRTRGIFG